jgi:hypothetical protein
MMYFTPLKSAVILGLCLLGAICCIPNLFSAPAPWLPWRQVHLGLDLRGGSYLLLEVDMKAVVKERLDSMVDGVRQALRPGSIVCPMARLIMRMNDVAFIPKHTSEGSVAFSHAATFSRAVAMTRSTSRLFSYRPPRWTFTSSRWCATASSTFCGNWAPAALSK